jgi:hypothetical protein
VPVISSTSSRGRSITNGRISAARRVARLRHSPDHRPGGGDPEAAGRPVAERPFDPDELGIAEQRAILLDAGVIATDQPDRQGTSGTKRSPARGRSALFLELHHGARLSSPLPRTLFGPAPPPRSSI